LVQLFSTQVWHAGVAASPAQTLVPQLEVQGPEQTQDTSALYAFSEGPGHRSLGLAPLTTTSLQLASLQGVGGWQLPIWQMFEQHELAETHVSPSFLHEPHVPA
jgi:hypothetical protein